MKTIFIALTGLLLTVGAARAQTATPTSISVDPRWGCDTVKDFPAPDLGEPQNIDNFKKQLIYYRCTAYEGDVAKVLAAAESGSRRARRRYRGRRSCSTSMRPR